MGMTECQVLNRVMSSKRAATEIIQMLAILSCQVLDLGNARVD